MTVWRMAFRAGKGGPSLWEDCRRLGVAAIEYGPVDDIDFTRHSEGEPHTAWSQLAPSQKASLRRLVYEMQPGDIIYVKEGTSIVGKGIVTGPYLFHKKSRIREPEDGSYWQHQRPVTWARDFLPVRIQLGRAQQQVVESLSNDDVTRVERASMTEFQSRPPSRFADEADIEGLKSEHLTTATKRSRRLRNRAFEAANGICAVCERDFTKLLGGRGVRVLQVHHREQLSARDAPTVTRLADLVVVCANCHLLLHLDARKTLSVDKLRSLLGIASSATS